MFSNAQSKFITTFTEEFIRELEFIADVAAKRATSRPTFFDQLIGRINLSANVLNTLAGFFPGGSAAVGTATQVVICIAMGMQYLYERDMNSNIDQMLEHTYQPKVLLRLMIEGVAREAARRHEFFLNHMCAPESIDLFAVVGVARILQYLSDHHGLALTSENLIRGLIEGKSGAWQQGFQNNQLNSQHPSIRTVSAETVYGHSAYMSLDGRYYVKEKSSSYFRTAEKYYVKMTVDGLPKAGIAVLRSAEITLSQYPEVPISANLDLHLQHYHPGYVILTKQDIEAYAVANRQAAVSLKAYYQNKGIICRDDLSGCDLSDGNFAEVDFSGANLERAILNNAIFEKAYLVSVNMRYAQVKNVNFRHANLSLLNAEEAVFENSDFIHASVFYSCFKNANLSNVQFIGSEWIGSDLLTIITSQEIKSNLIPLSTAIEKLMEQQKIQAEHLNTLEQQILEYLQNPEANIARSVSRKLKKIKNRILSDQDLVKDLSLYVPVQASLNSFSRDTFDLDQRVQDFLVSENRVMLILGEAGEGKSTFNRYLQRQLWSTWNEGDPIPLFIPLRSLKNPKHQLMQETLQQEFFSSEEIAYLQEHYTFVLSLDGYDEMTSTPNLYISNRLDRWQAKVTITCRKQYILQFPNYKRCFIPISGERLLEQAFQEVTVALFNEDQIDRYMTKFLEVRPNDAQYTDVASYRREMDKIRGLDILIKTPFLLMIALEVLPDIIRKYEEHADSAHHQEIKKTELYEAFMQWWFRRAEIQVILNEQQDEEGWNDITQDFEVAAEELAVEMTHAEVTEVFFSTDNYKRNPEWYRQSFKRKEIISVTQQSLETFSFEENEREKALIILYISDAPTPEEKWRVVARNNAGGLTSHVYVSRGKTEWLTVAELARRWSTRTSSNPEYLAEIRRKIQILDNIDQMLRLKTPETLTSQEKEQVFSAIVLGMTHPWQRFFNFNDQKIRQVFHGLPVKPTSRGGYAFIHIEVLTYFGKQAGQRDIPGVIRHIEDNAMPKMMPAMMQHGMFQAVPQISAANNPMAQPAIVQQTPLSEASKPETKSNRCTIC